MLDIAIKMYSVVWLSSKGCASILDVANTGFKNSPNQCPPPNALGTFNNPPIAAKAAKTINGKVICHGKSCKCDCCSAVPRNSQKKIMNSKRNIKNAEKNEPINPNTHNTRLKKKACAKISSLEKKPESGGIPAIAMVP